MIGNIQNNPGLIQCLSAISCHRLPNAFYYGLIHARQAEIPEKTSRNISLYHTVVGQSLTLDLLCTLRLMLDKATETALFNKCFIVPKALNNHKKGESLLAKHLTVQTTDIFK